MSRTGFGQRPGDVEGVLQTGAANYLEQQLNPERIDDSAADARLAEYEKLRIDQSQSIQAPRRILPDDVLLQVRAQKLIRALYSQRQLQEVMVDFWFNHFNVYAEKSDLRFLLASYEYDAIRPHALGKFKDLLVATAKHPAMLIYLDNALSTSPKLTGRQRELQGDTPPGINENYARELMELHTLGVDGGYTQRDVEEVARCFTGWTIDRLPQGMVFTNDIRGRVGFTFDATIHDAGDKTVLGRRIPAGGYDEGETVLNILAHHLSTARCIATKLVRKFVADDPPSPLVNQVAEVFTKSNGDIRAMLSAIVTSQEFNSPAAYRAKAKSPFEAIVSMVRSVNGEVDTSYRPNVPTIITRMIDGVENSMQITRSNSSPIQVLIDVIDQAGQPFYRYPAPNGFPDNSRYWMDSGAFIDRLRFALALTGNQVSGVVVDIETLIKTFEGDPKLDTAWRVAVGTLTGAVGGRFVHVTSPTQAGQRQPTPDRSTAIVDAFALALGSPEFQYR